MLEYWGKINLSGFVDMTTKHTILQQTLPDGCIAPYLVPIIRAAEKAAKRPVEHRGQPRLLPRYTVRVDGERFEFTQTRSLEKFLRNIRIGAECVIYRNRGLGATISFEIDDIEKF